MGKPVGALTRGTTNPNRLRRIDRWLIHSECSRLRSLERARVVDLGFGASAITASELSQRLTAHVRPDLEVIGIEIDAERVRVAKALEADGLRFVHGGFEIPVEGRVDVVRAANVLRQYEEAEVFPAWQVMAGRINPGGLIIDATSDEIGRLASWVAIRVGADQQPEPETFTISVQVSSLEKPSAVAARLPKILIHHNVAGERIHQVLADLDLAWERTAPQSVFGARAHFLAMCEYATAHGLALASGRTRWRLGEITFPWAEVTN